SGPDRLIIRPPGEPERVAPSADAGEEMALGVAPEVVGLNKSNVSLIHVPWRDVSRRNQVPEPLRGVGIDFVVVGGHSLPHLPEILPALPDPVEDGLDALAQGGHAPLPLPTWA